MLRHVIGLLAGAVLGGVLLVAVLVAGWIAPAPIFGAILAGFALGWPAAILVTRRIRPIGSDPAAAPPREPS